MRRTLSIIALAIITVASPLFGAFNPVQADHLFDTDHFIEARTLLIGGKPPLLVTLVQVIADGDHNPGQAPEDVALQIGRAHV